MRLFGTDAELLEEAGCDVARITELERSLVAGLIECPRADIHVHVGRDRDGHEIDVDGLLADMDAWGIRRTVIFAPNDPGPDGDFADANATVRRAAEVAPARLIDFCRVDPEISALSVMEEAMRHGARGLKLHPIAQGRPPESAASIACVRRATEFGWPVIMHAGFGARSLADPFLGVLNAVPEARLILAHGARGDARAVSDALADHPGVWFDTSLATLSDLVILPRERLIFGTDRPYGDHATALQLVDHAARLAKWSEADVRRVLVGNFDDILGA